MEDSQESDLQIKGHPGRSVGRLPVDWGSGHGGGKFETGNRINQPQDLHRRKTCEIYTPWGDEWTCLRWAACSSVSTLMGGKSRRGRVGRVAGGPRAWGWTSARRGGGGEGGGLDAARWKYKYVSTLLTVRRLKFRKQDLHPSLLPPHFKIAVSPQFTNSTHICIF